VALGIASAPGLAAAQNVTFDGNTSYRLIDPNYRSGGPRTIDVKTSNGDIEIDVGTVRTENPTGNIGVGIAATNTGSGNVTVRSKELIAFGPNPVGGIEVRASAGRVLIDSEVLNSRFSAGMRVTGGSSVSINSGTLTTVGSAGDFGSARGISITSPGASIDITSGAITTSSLDSTGIWIARGSGAVTIKSGTISAGGAINRRESSGGIAVLGASGPVTITTTGDTISAGTAIWARGEGPDADVQVTTGAGTTTRGGPRYAAIHAESTADVTIVNQGTVQSSTRADPPEFQLCYLPDRGYFYCPAPPPPNPLPAVAGVAMLAEAGGQATIVSNVVIGRDGDAIRAVGGTGASITSATTTGNVRAVANDGNASIVSGQLLTGALYAVAPNGVARVTSEDIVNTSVHGTGITAAGRLGAIVVAGSVDTANYAINASSSEGDVSVTTSGTITSRGTYAVSVSGANNSIVNHGTIRSLSLYEAILASGATTLDNRGTITTSGRTAVQFDGANDTVILRTGSVVNGVIAGGGGTDAAILIGTLSGPSASQTLANFSEFGSLAVREGYWAALATNTSLFAKLTINGGAALELVDGATGIVGDTGTLTNDGTLIFNRRDAFAFASGLTGTGTLIQRGAGKIAFGGNFAFTGTTWLEGGTIELAAPVATNAKLVLEGTGTVDLGSTHQVVAELRGLSPNVRVTLAGGSLTLNQAADTRFAGQLAGLGTVRKQGQGQLNLAGDGTRFTGAVEVSGGTLSINGDFSNANFVVNPGGKLGGRGTIGGTSVNGGTLAPGNSIDRLSVNGNIAFTSASLFEIEVNPAGQGDRLDVTGTAILGGGRVQVLAENGSYRPMTDYTILTANGGISGTFGSVTDNLAFLDPSLIYSANAVTLRLVRNDIDFAAYGANPAQAAIGGLIESFGYGNVLYNETLLLADNDVGFSFASLTGEVYPTHSAALVETVEMVRRQVAGVAPKTDGMSGWATGLYSTIEGGNMHLKGHGVAGGLSYRAGGFSVSSGLGLLELSNESSDSLQGDLVFAVAQVGYDWTSGLSIGAGAQVGWIDATTHRQTTLGTIGSAVGGEIDGDYLQLFGEIKYSRAIARNLAVELFGGISNVSVRLDPVVEGGGATALAVSAINRDVTFGDVGLRLSGGAASNIRPFASAAYRHAWGDRASLTPVSFTGTTGSALIGSLPIAANAAELSAGLVMTLGAVNFEVTYDGMISESFDSHGLSARFRLLF
jgi:autotransporter-associated beta strand protein